MRRLRLLLAGRRADGERGAIAVLTAVLVMFVAIGMLALTVDLGNVTYNRAQLQNGADATSLALAAACAQQTDDGAECAVTDQLRALAVKNANATDQSMQILTDQRTCISANYSGPTDLPDCTGTTSPTSLQSCQPIPAKLPASASYVEVTTQTEMKDGSSVLPFHFAQLLKGGKDGATTQACARAAWVAAGSTGTTLPITMGMCDWNNATAGGTKYAPAPPYSVPAGSGSAPPAEVRTPDNYVTGIFAHDSDGNMCSDQPNGGFSWLAPDSTADPDCDVTIDAGDNAPSNPGASVPCKSVLAKYLGKIVTIPVFDGFTGSGRNARYHIKGIAAFYLAGYDNVPSAKPHKTSSVYTEPSGVCTGKCNASTTYVWGWFVSTLLPIDSTATDPGAEDLGARVVIPAG
ncbi:pilus assembly protein TadG-related protein [Flexivirga sp. B27]